MHTYQKFDNQMVNSKLMPQAIEIEQAVLGAILIDPDSILVAGLPEEAFYNIENKHVFKACNELFHSGRPIDIMTVTNELRTLNLLDEVGGAYYVSTLTNRVASSDHIDEHSKILIQKLIKRMHINMGYDLSKKGYDDTQDGFEVNDLVADQLQEIQDVINLKKSNKSSLKLIQEATDKIQKSLGSDGITGLVTGMNKIDEKMGGVQNSDLIILAARPGKGKTSLAMRIAENVAIKHHVVFFSLEMSSLQLTNKRISMATGYSIKELRSPENINWNHYNKCITKISHENLIIDDTPSLSINQLRSKAKLLKIKKDIKLIVVDYIQLMSATNQKGNREQEISAISRGLKLIAKELDIPVIALSQLSRSVENRGGDKRPMLSDLRESGAIEQDADSVLFLYRPEYYQITEDHNGNSTEGLAEVIFAKNRQGSLGIAELQFIGHNTDFKNIN